MVEKGVVCFTLIVYSLSIGRVLLHESVVIKNNNVLRAIIVGCAWFLPVDGQGLGPWPRNKVVVSTDVPRFSTYACPGSSLMLGFTVSAGDQHTNIG